MAACRLYANDGSVHNQAGVFYHRAHAEAAERPHGGRETDNNFGASTCVCTKHNVEALQGCGLAGNEVFAI